MNIEDVNLIIRSCFINIVAMIIFLKINNIRQIELNRKIKIVILIVISIILEFILRKNFDRVITYIIICFIEILILQIFIKIKISNIFISIISSYVLSYLVLIISGTIEYLIQLLLNNSCVTMNLMFTMLIEITIIYLILRSKRIKNGIPFLKKENEYLKIVCINICMVLILLYELLGYNNEKIYKYSYYYYILFGILSIILIQKAITMYYKQKLTDDTISEYKKEIIQKDNEIEKLKSEAFKISKINHEFYNRQKALELMVTNNMNKFNIEAGADLDILDRISKISSEHEEKMKSIVEVNDIPLTGVNELDDMFKYMQNECFKFGIGFNLQVIGNIYYLINHFIDKNKLETLIGDHIRDAIIAVNSRADNINKEILVILGMHDNFYEFCVYDTGIEFEIDTLLKLGLVPITTHKNDGGTGIGFVTTFETMKNSKASLIIDEKNSVQNTGFTKSVTIKFDGKNEYRIHSYRASDIRKKINDNRIYVSE